MNRRTVLIFLAVLIILVVISFFAGRHAAAPTEQKPATASASPEQVNSQNEGDTPVQPDINNQEFKLAGSNVSCSTSTVNGSTSRNCSGNIRVIPRAQADMEPGLYKINEQTKLIHNGAEQDLNSLQQLSQADTTVRLKLADGSIDTLREISY
jgi:hypothetical protein